MGNVESDHNLSHHSEDKTSHFLASGNDSQLTKDNKILTKSYQKKKLSLARKETMLRNQKAPFNDTSMAKKFNNVKS